MSGLIERIRNPMWMIVNGSPVRFYIFVCGIPVRVPKGIAFLSARVREGLSLRA